MASRTVATSALAANGPSAVDSPGCPRGVHPVAIRNSESKAHNTPFTVCLCASVVTLIAGCGPVSFLVTPVPASQQLEEWVISRESIWAGRKIAVVDVDGVLANARSTSIMGTTGENPVSFFKEKLDKAARDGNVKAVVLRINSPGGGVTASDLMYSELMRFREKSKKPVIACMMDVAASGGYYLACAADRIYAHPSTVTGSIGVILVMPEVSGTMQKLGIRPNVFKSGDLKDAGSPFREMNERDRAVFQGLIDQMYDRFLAVVRRARPAIDEDRLRQLADGRVYLAAEARENGLIDEIGTLHEAIAAAKAAAGLEKEKIIVVQYARPLAHKPNIYAGSPAPQVNLIHVQLPEWLGSPTPQFMYLWAPGW